MARTAKRSDGGERGDVRAEGGEEGGDGNGNGDIDVGEDEEEDIDGYAQVPEAEVSPKRRVRAPLTKDVRRINIRAYAIVEWFRLPAGLELDAKPRFKRWPAINKILRLISLCSPSSAAAERVFSLLKLVMSSKDFAKLNTTGETSAMLRSNDHATE